MGTISLMLLSVPAVAAINAHPRLWADSAHLADMRAKVTSGSPEWVSFRNYVDAYYPIWVSSPSSYAQYTPFYGHNFALMYLVLAGMSDSGGSCLNRVCTGFGVQQTAVAYGTMAATFLNLYISNADAYCQQQWMQNCSASYPLLSSASAGNTGPLLMLMYDWIYPFLSSNDKAAFVTQMRYATIFEYSRWQSYWADPMNNGTNRIWNWIQMVGYGTFGDNPTDSGQTNAEITEAHTYYSNYMQPFWTTTGIGAGSPDGSEYGWENPIAWTQFILTARTGEGLDLLAANQIPNFVNDWAYATIYILTSPVLTGAGSMFNWGDEEHPGHFSDASREAGLWMANLATGTAQQYIRFWVDNAGQLTFSSTGYEWETFLLHSSTWSSADYRTLLSPSYYGSGFGIASWRSDWTPNATWVTFFDGFTSSNHTHSSTGNFTVFRKGQWLAEDYPGYQLCFADASVHNVMMYKGPSDTIWKGPVANLSVGRGAIMRYEDATNYSYAQADSTQSYRSTRTNLDWLNATNVGREIVYIKPDYVVVLDRATFRDANTQIRFDLTTPNLPTLAGNVITHTNGGQSLFLTPVSPTVDVSIVDFSTISNWTWEGDPTSCNNSYTGSWFKQAQVQTHVGGTSQTLLNVMQAADAGVSPTPILQIGTGNVLGAQIKDSKGDWVVAFNNVVPVASFSLPISYTITAGSTFRNHLILNMPPNTPVNVQITGGTVTVSAAGGPGSAYTTSANGTLSFSDGTPLTSACDLNNDGAVNNLDVAVATSQALGFTHCGNADLTQNGFCDIVDVQRIINAIASGVCRVGP